MGRVEPPSHVFNHFETLLLNTACAAAFAEAFLFATNNLETHAARWRAPGSAPVMDACGLAGGSYSRQAGAEAGDYTKTIFARESVGCMREVGQICMSVWVSLELGQNHTLCACVQLSVF